MPGLTFRDCPLCKMKNIDKYHALVCLNARRTVRSYAHDNVEKVVHELYRDDAGLISYRQPKWDTRGELTDLQVHSDEGQTKEIDFVTILPIADSYASDAAAMQGSAAEKAAKLKTNKHGPSCEAAGIDFVPFAIESFGLLGKAAIKEVQGI